LPTSKKLTELTTEFKQGNENVKLTLEDDEKISSQLKTLERKHLLAYAIAMDHYHHEKNPKMLGGIDDSRTALHTEELRNHMNNFMQRYPELDSIAKCNELMNKYKIEFKDN